MSDRGGAAMAGGLHGIGADTGTRNAILHISMSDTNQINMEARSCADGSG
jgi:hypothetical protein